MTVTLTRSTNYPNLYRVYDADGIRLGSVIKDNRWTVRGNPVFWTAVRRSGTWIAEARTRQEAVALLTAATAADPR